jgi:hypothetical protein
MNSSYLEITYLPLNTCSFSPDPGENVWMRGKKAFFVIDKLKPLTPTLSRRERGV